MRTVRKSLLVLVVIGLAVLASLYAWAMHDTPKPSIATPERLVADAAAIERGRYLVAAGDCVACHTAPKGQPFAGGLALDSPVGQIYSSNITPDRKNGIGDYTLDDFDRALRHGIAKRGDTLYPAMPYPSYAHMTPDDIAAMYAYLMHDVAAVDAPNHDTRIRWPLSARWPLAIWRKLYAPDPAVVAAAGRYPDAAVARGAYLVQGPGHCGSCHTPRAVTLQEKALDDGSPDYLAGGAQIDGWVSVNLRGDAGDGLGGWSPDDIVATLKTGRNPTRAVIGTAMTDVVYHSTQYLTDADLGAIAGYLKSLPGTKNDGIAYVASDETAKALKAGINATRGAELYVDNCAACHATDGLGRRMALPAIAGNSSVLSPDAASIIRLVLNGSELPSLPAAPSPLGMPAFGWRLSDAEAAELVTFVRTSWGNRAPAVKAGDVAKVRAALAAEGEPMR